MPLDGSAVLYPTHSATKLAKASGRSLLGAALAGELAFERIALGRRVVFAFRRRDLEKFARDRQARNARTAA